MNEATLRSVAGAMRAGVDTVGGTIDALLRRRRPPPREVDAHTEPLRAVLFGPSQQRPVFGTLESLVGKWRADPDDWLWVHADAGLTAIRWECERLGIEPAVLRSASDADSPPVAERIGGTMRVLWREIAEAGPTVELTTEPLHAFVADRVVASCSQGASRAVEELGAELLAGAVTVGGPTDLAVRLARRVGEGLVDAVGRVETVLDGLEDRVFAEPDDAVLGELTAWKTRLRAVARVGRGHERVAALIVQVDAADASPESRAAGSAVRELSERLRSLAEMYAHTATDLTDGYLAMSAHRLNRVMQILTVITVIFVPMTFIAGVYGMNFVNMPELGTRHGYFVVVAVMVAAGVAQVVFFRRRKWI